MMLVGIWRPLAVPLFRGERQLLHISRLLDDTTDASRFTRRGPRIDGGPQ
jgi:hypothetical protein